jgi:hypothetical protein
MMIGARPEGITVAPLGAAGVPFCAALFAAPFTAGTRGLIADWRPLATRWFESEETGLAGEEMTAPTGA